MTFAIEKYGDLTALMCNGRIVAYEGRITSIDKVGPGRWEGVAGGEPFEIIGGRASGGSSREWFVKWKPGYGDKFVPFSSAIKAVRAIETC